MWRILAIVTIALATTAGNAYQIGKPLSGPCPKKSFGLRALNSFGLIGQHTPHFTGECIQTGEQIDLGEFGSGKRFHFMLVGNDCRTCGLVFQVFERAWRKYSHDELRVSGVVALRPDVEPTQEKHNSAEEDNTEFRTRATEFVKANDITFPVAFDCLSTEKILADPNAVNYSVKRLLCEQQPPIAILAYDGVVIWGFEGIPDDLGIKVVLQKAGEEVARVKFRHRASR